MNSAHKRLLLDFALEMVRSRFLAQAQVAQLSDLVMTPKLSVELSAVWQRRRLGRLIMQVQLIVFTRKRTSKLTTKKWHTL